MPRLTLGPIILVACAGGTGPLPEDPADPGPRGEITFAVQDTFSGSAAVGLRLRVGDREGLTDSEGMVLLQVHPGWQSFQVNGVGYDQRHGAVSVPPVIGTVWILVRPAAPIVSRCRLGPDGVLARVTDLAGRKTILRRAISYIEFHGDEGPEVIPTTRLHWIAVDDVSYDVLLPALPPPSDSLRWFIFDRERHVRPQGCAPTSECQDCTQ